jgi:hypothetical protein
MAAKNRYAKLSNKRWRDMTPEERDAEVKELDKPIDPGQIKPLSKKQRLLWDRSRASKPNVAIVVYDGRTDIVVRLDDELLQRVNSYAKKNKTNLPKMIDQGLRGLLAFAG